MKLLFEDKGILISNERQAEFAIDPLFIRRWSPRAFDRSPIPENIIKSLFEAARWAMSCYNEQPWLFLYASSEEDLKIYRSLLAEFNQKWAINAPVIGFLFARRRFKRNDKPNDWASFDCGAAWMAMTIQARLLGLYTHGMGGFDREKIYDALGVPKKDYEAICAFTIGMYGDPESLPDDMKKTEKPNERKPLAEIVIKGKFAH
jgi:nitroreductase